MAIVLDGNNLLTTGVLNSMTAQSASGTSVDFTGIPAGVKRITVMLSSVSTNGSVGLKFQLGSGSIQNTGYGGNCSQIGAGAAAASSTSGFDSYGDDGAAFTRSGLITFCLIGANTWAMNGTYGIGPAYAYHYIFSGTVTLSGSIDRLRITTKNGTDTFDAGTINVLYE